MKLPDIEHLCDIRVELGPPVELGRTDRGNRRIIPIVGGTFSGARLRGRVMNLGADWQTVFGETAAELDTRYVLETDDGARIDIRNFGIRHGPPETIAALAEGRTVDPSAYYMRTHARFETGDSRYDWLNRAMCFGSGAREPSAVRMTIFEIK